MGTGPSRPALRARYERKQDEVTAAAATVFAKQGYEQTSVSALAEQIGLATGALYHYFPGKRELLVSICDQLNRPVLEPARKLLEEEADPSRAVERLLELWVGHALGHRDHLLVFTQVRHLVDHGEEWSEVRRDRKEFERILDTAIERLHAAGANRLDDPQLTRGALLGMVNHTPQWFRPRGRLSPAEIAAGYARLVLA